MDYDEIARRIIDESLDKLKIFKNKWYYLSKEDCQKVLKIYKLIVELGADEE